MTRSTGKPSNTDLQRNADAPLASPTGGDDGQFAGGAGLQRTQTRFVTAMKVQVARDLEVVHEGVMAEARLARERFYYSWLVNTKENGPDVIVVDGQKKKPVTGLSIAAAQSFLRNYGNCTYEIDIVEEGPAHWTLRATFIDFEKGIAVPRLLRAKKGGLESNYDRERAMDMSFQKAQSQAIRNCILDAMPEYMRQDAMEEAQKAAAEKVAPKGDAGALAKKVEGWRGYWLKRKVMDEQMVKRVGRPFAQWTREDCAMLKALSTAIEDGRTSVESEFGNAAAPAPAAPPADPPAEREPGEDAPADDDRWMKE